MLAPEFLPVWGGVGTYIVELVRHLPRDIEVHVITPKREGFGEEKISTSDYDFSEYFGNNIHVHFVCDASDTFIYNAKFQYACFKHVPKLVKEEQIDLIHSHTAHMPDLLLQFKKLTIPTVTTVHTTIQGQRDGAKKSGTGFWDLEFSEKATRLAYPALRFAEIIYFSRKRYYITVSEWMKNQLQTQVKGMNHSSISVIYNSVDPKRYSPSNINSPNQRTMVLFTGRIIAAKGIGYLIEAIPKILQRHPDTIFTFIGAGNSVVYKRLLREKGVSEKNYEFLGYLKEASDLVKYYRASSVYLAPSLYENLPIRILEAMACGIPVVASNVCGIPECIDNGVNGILTQPGSVDELTNAICSLLSDSSLRKKMGDNARKTVLEKFNWDVNAIKTVKVYRDVLEKFGDQVNLKIGC